MRVSSMDWLSAEVGSEFPVIGGTQAERSGQWPLGRVFQRWLLSREVVRTIWPWSPIFSGRRDSIVSRSVPTSSNQSRTYQTPPAVFLPLPGLGFEPGVQMLSQLMHKEMTQECFSWHPTQLSVQQLVWGLAQRVTQRSSESIHTWKLRAGRKTSAFPKVPTGKRSSQAEAPRALTVKSNLRNCIIKTWHGQHLDLDNISFQRHKLGKISLRPGSLKWTTRYSYGPIKQICNEDEENHAGNHPTQCQ